MKFPRRQFLRLAATAAVLPAVSRIAGAQTYPVRQVRIVVGFPAGGADDIHARLMGQWLSERLGQTFVIENRPGVSSLLAAEAVARAPADGYTLLTLSAPTAISATLYQSPNVDLVRSISPVASLVRVNFLMLINPDLPAKNVTEFIAYAKANPNKISMGSAGIGTPHHVAGELFKIMAGVTMLHVPYRGEAPGFADLMGGQVQVMFATATGSIEYVKSGKLRALAVAGAERLPALPDVPALNDFVPGFDVKGWVGIGVPKGTPSDVVDRLNREINVGLANPSILSRYADLGVEPFPGSPADFGRLISDESEKWSKVIRLANIKVE